ncbi:transposase [Agrobacterium tumefaciens]|uniref:IS66 family transposase n=1 Tax=Agrobacterium tumefaciens TaxID=358 RepID=UPI001574025D|nr:transposase [Agrobacterium tumefaciens]
MEFGANVVEQAIRTQVIARKNSLFAGRDGGAGPAGLARLFHLAKMSAVDPQSWRPMRLWDKDMNGQVAKSTRSMLWKYMA